MLTAATCGAGQCLLSHFRSEVANGRCAADALVSPPHDAKQLRKMQPYPPLGTLYAATALRSAGISVAVFDTMLLNLCPAFARRSKNTSRIVVIYEDDFNFVSKMCLTHMREAANELATIARSRGSHRNSTWIGCDRPRQRVFRHWSRLHPERRSRTDSDRSLQRLLQSRSWTHSWTRAPSFCIWQSGDPVYLRPLILRGPICHGWHGT